MKSVGFNHGKSECSRKGRVTTTSTWVLVAPFHTYSAHVVVSASSLGHLQNNSGCTLIRELSGIQICLIQTLRWRDLQALEFTVPISKQIARRVIVPLVVFWLEGLSTISGSHVGSMVLQLWGIGNIWSTPEQSQFWEWKCPVLYTGRKINY